jgi:HlyD family secretion protein
MRRLTVGSVFAMLPLVLASCGDNDGTPSGSGFVEATEVVVSSEVAGTLEDLYFDEGDEIRAGDTIGLIDTTKLSLKLAQAKARLGAAVTGEETTRLQIEQADLDSALAHTDYMRMKRLIDKGSINRQQYDQAETRYLQMRLARKAAAAALDRAAAERRMAQTEIALLEDQLADCRPVSPISGSVVTTYAERGELLGIGKPLIKVAELDPVTVKIYLPPGSLTRIKLGARAEVDPEDGETQPLAGEVTWISPEAEFTPKNVQTKEARADLVYAVRVTVPNPDQALKIGMPVLVTIP